MHDLLTHKPCFDMFWTSRTYCFYYSPAAVCTEREIYSVLTVTELKKHSNHFPTFPKQAC